MFSSLALSFLASCVLTILLLRVTIILAKRYRMFSYKRLRDIHQGNVSRFGGVALFLSFWTIFFLHPLLVISPLLWGLFSASIILFAGSILDDLKEQSWLIQLCFQVATLFPLMFVGMSIEFIRAPSGEIFYLSHIWGSVMATLWILFTMNAFNWLDGLDGLASGVGLMAVCALFFLSLTPQVNQPPLAIMNATMAGALTAFLMVNMPPAKIFLGTSGALFLGLFLGTQAIVAGGKLATLSLVLAPFFLDALWVIFERIKKRHSPFSPDLLHLHFQLFRKGVKKGTILFSYLATSGMLGILALQLGTQGKFFAILLLAIIFILARSIMSLDALRKETYNAKYDQKGGRR